MKYRWKKLIALSLVVCMFGMLLTGCSSAPVAGDKVNAPVYLDAPESITDEAEPDIGESESNTDETEDDNTNDSDHGNMETPAQDNADDSANAENPSETSGKWHVYDPDLAAAVDADFEGVVHKIDTDSFFIYPMETELMENGILISSSLGPDAEIPDEELLEVVFDSDTVFTLQDIYDGGDRHEDSEVSFQAVEKGLSVALKGKFQNDIYHATSIRIIKVH